jgi:hypothetical protein
MGSHFQDGPERRKKIRSEAHTNPIQRFSGECSSRLLKGVFQNNDQKFFLCHCGHFREKEYIFLYWTFKKRKRNDLDEEKHLTELKFETLEFIRNKSARRLDLMDAEASKLFGKRRILENSFEKHFEMIKFRTKFEQIIRINKF